MAESVQNRSVGGRETGALSEEHLQLAVNVAQLGTWSYDPAEDLMYLDQRMRTVLGVDDTTKTISLSEVFEFAHPEDRMSIKKAVRNASDPSSGTPFSIEYRIVQDHGTVRWISANGQARFDEETGEATRFIGTARDINERKNQEAKMETMNEILEERVEKRTKSLLSYQDQLRLLASQLSKAEEQERRQLATRLHDNLGQLLAMCKMKIDTLYQNRSPERSGSDIKELAELIEEALNYTRELMSDLKPPPALDEENLAGVMNWLARKMEKHGLHVTIEDDGQPKSLSEEVRTTLLQAVRELLFNVVKHTDVDQARLYLSRIDGQVQITVEDEGKGFNPEDKRETPGDDSGFGLFNIFERMDLLGGHFEIRSEPKTGTRAILTVPLQQREKSELKYRPTGKVSTESPGKSTIQAELWQNIRILIVDDHEMVRRGLRQMIENQNDLIVIAEASDGKEAVNSARETSPDVIVMDVNMPGMDGIEATRNITSEMPDVRVIGLSLHDEKGVARDMRSAGATAYLSKTEAFESLCATIRSEARMAGQ